MAAIKKQMNANALKVKKMQNIDFTVSWRILLNTHFREFIFYFDFFIVFFGFALPWLCGGVKCVELAVID